MDKGDYCKTCKICGKGFERIKNLHVHISKSEKMSLLNYYHKFFPRRDLFNGELLPFNTIDQYFTTFFSCKYNMSTWFKSQNGSKKAVEIAQKILLNRKNKNHLTLAPTQVELRTINAPSVGGFLSLFDYNEYCRSIGLRPRLDYTNYTIKPINHEIKVIIDSREQQPFEFKKSRRSKIDVGDYTAFGDHYSDVFIDRKNINDFFSTFYTVKSFERFKKEIIRADEMGVYLFVLVEGSLNTCTSYKTRFVKDRGFVPHTFKNVRTLLEENDNLQFVFCKDRDHANEICLKILSQGKDVMNMDVQYLIDKGGF